MYMPDILPAVEGYNHRPVANGFIHINLRTLAGTSVYQPCIHIHG